MQSKYQVKYIRLSNFFYYNRVNLYKRFSLFQFNASKCVESKLM